MTRDFKKLRRDDSRPSSRNQSSSNYRDGRSPRPVRPRLNRETVDRAWESGAQPQHADYHPRGGSGQHPRNNGWRNKQESEYSSYNGRGNNSDNQSNRSDNNRQDRYRDNRGNRQGNYRNNRTGNDRDGERSFGNSRGPNARPFESHKANRRTSGDSHFEDRRDSFRGSNRSGSSRFQDRDRPYNQSRDRRRPYSQDRGQSFGYEDRPQREDHRDSRDRRGPQPRDARNTQNLRWQTRPAAQGEHSSFKKQSFTDRSDHTPSKEQFEGDYERFEPRDSYEHRSPRAAERPFRGTRNSRDTQAPHNGRDRYSRQKAQDESRQPEERHVTRLPDGRILKGPRPAQRKNASFWTEVTEETHSLLNNVQVPSTPTELDTATSEAPRADTQSGAIPEVPVHGPVEVEAANGTANESENVAAPLAVPDEVGPAGTTSTDALSPEEAVQSVTQQKRRSRIASAIARGKKTPKVHSSGPKPSQSGFKWPTP